MTNFFRRAMILAGAGLALAACQAADGTSQAPDTALVAGIMSGLGAVDPHAKQIEYKPRAPLAMPSDATKLPQPETNVAGANSPDWPKNQQNASLEAVKQVYKDDDYATRENLGKQLTPEQMRGINVISDKERDIAAEKRDQDIISGSTLTAEERKKINSNALGTAGALRNGAGQESTSSKLAKRRYLTEPPAEYSQPAAGAPLPEAVKTERKPTNYDPYSSEQLDMKCLEETGGECRR